jgi:hypothetical protein
VFAHLDAFHAPRAILRCAKLYVFMEEKIDPHKDPFRAHIETLPTRGAVLGVEGDEFGLTAFLFVWVFHEGDGTPNGRR